MADEKKSMATGTKILLGAVALGAGGVVCIGGSGLALLLATRGADDTIIGDGNDYPPPPGNPKGSFYVPPPDTGPPDAGPPEVIPPPANPKGSLYDQGFPPPPTPPPTTPKP